jgi:hypothetical protein
MSAKDLGVAPKDGWYFVKMTKEIETTKILETGLVKLEHSSFKLLDKVIRNLRS